MARCTRTRNLEVHHIRRDGGSGIDNAQVLCPDCHRKRQVMGHRVNHRFHLVKK